MQHHQGQSIPQLVSFPKSAILAKENSIHCSNLKVCYGPHVAIENLSCQFASGTLTAVIGPNGGGKSTLLKVMMGYIKPSAGKVIMGDAAYKRVAYLPQHTDIDRSFPMTVYDLVAMGLCHHQGFFRAFQRQSQEAIEHALDRVGLADFRQRPLHSLSGGQLQRVLFARMSLQNASIILLDEPFAAIDAPTMELLAKMLKQWQEEGRTLVVILHDLDIVREFFPHTLILARKCVANGPTVDVLNLDNFRKAKDFSHCWENDIYQSRSPLAEVKAG